MPRLPVQILLVEDDPSLQFTIQTALEEKGYAVEAVSTTGEAIERLTTDEALRARLIAEGPRQAARFSWQSAAEATWQALRSVVE